MPVLDVMYRLGDAMADALAEQGVREGDLEAWHGWWVATCTAIATVPSEKHSEVARQLLQGINGWVDLIIEVQHGR